MASDEASQPWIPNPKIIRGLVRGLQEGEAISHALSQDGVCASMYVVICHEVTTYRKIEAEVKALGYKYQWQLKRWRVWRDSRQLTAFRPDIHEADRPAQEPGVRQWANSGDQTCTATLNDFIAVAGRSRAKPRPLPLRRSGPSSNVESAQFKVSVFGIVFQCFLFWHRVFSVLGTKDHVHQVLWHCEKEKGTQLSTLFCECTFDFCVFRLLFLSAPLYLPAPSLESREGVFQNLLYAQVQSCMRAPAVLGLYL